MQKSNSLLSLSGVSSLHSDNDDDDFSLSHGSLVFDDTLADSSHVGSIVAFDDTVDAGSILLHSTTRIEEQSALIGEEDDDNQHNISKSGNSLQHQEEEEQLELENTQFSCNDQSDKEFGTSASVIEFASPDELILKQISNLVRAKKPKDARPLLSFFCSAGMTCQGAIAKIGRNITHTEWNNANKYAIFPGAGEPPPVKFWKDYREKTSKDQLVQFMEWLRAADLLQNLSFGQKIVTYSNGLHVAIESVKRKDHVRNIVRKYYTTFLESREQFSGDGCYEHIDDDDEMDQDEGKRQVISYQIMLIKT